MAETTGNAALWGQIPWNIKSCPRLPLNWWIQMERDRGPQWPLWEPVSATPALCWGKVFPKFTQVFSLDWFCQAKKNECAYSEKQCSGVGSDTALPLHHTDTSSVPCWALWIITRWCLQEREASLVMSTSLRWITKSLCALSGAICTGKTLLHVFQRPQLKSDFMLYAKVDFSHEHAYESKQRIQHSSWEHPPYPKPLSWCEGDNHEASPAVPPGPHVPLSLWRHPRKRVAGTQGCSCVDWTRFPCPCGLEETVWLCTYPLHRLPILGLFPCTWGLVMPGLRCCNFDVVILPWLW